MLVWRLMLFSLPFAPSLQADGKVGDPYTTAYRRRQAAANPKLFESYEHSENITREVEAFFELGASAAGPSVCSPSTMQ